MAPLSSLLHPYSGLSRLPFQPSYSSNAAPTPSLPLYILPLRPTTLEPASPVISSLPPLLHPPPTPPPFRLFFALRPYPPSTQRERETTSSSFSFLFPRTSENHRSSAFSFYALSLSVQTYREQPRTRCPLLPSQLPLSPSPLSPPPPPISTTILAYFPRDDARGKEGGDREGNFKARVQTGENDALSPGCFGIDTGHTHAHARTRTPYPRLIGKNLISSSRDHR